MIETIKFQTFHWHNITSPNEKNIEYLSETFHFHHLALEDCRSTIQNPKVDDYGSYLFMVFHLPRYNKQNLRTSALELNVFLGKNYLITLSNGTLKPLNAFFDNFKKEKIRADIQEPALLLYEILNLSFNYCFPMLEMIGSKLDSVEDALYEDQSRRTLENLSFITQDIINFRRVISPQRYFIKDLESVKSKFISNNLELYFNDIEDKIDRIWETLNNYKEVCDVLQRTNESIITQRLNEIIKILTIFSVIMLPLTVITGFYGMNVTGLPFASHKLAAEIIIGLLILVIAGMLYYFNRKKWL